MPITKSVRRNIRMDTFKKIEDFLKKQKEPIRTSNIMRELNVDYNSVKIALGMMKIKTYKDGRISLVVKNG